MASKLHTSNIHFGYVTYFLLVHVVGIYGMWYASYYADWQTNVFAIVYFFLAHLAITCGAHRLYSHESFEATKSLQYLLVCLFSATFQGNIIWWVGKHRYHHAKEDQPGDPHSPEDGFFHSHMGWLMKHNGWSTPPPKQYITHFNRRNEDGELKYCPAHWQRTHYYKISILMAFVIPTLFGLFWGDVLGGLLVGGFTRLLCQYHLTWVVNSVGHRFGEHKKGLSTNVWLLAIPTVGESFHANHHESPGDYRLGRKWYELDLGTYFIRFCQFLGFAKNLKTPADKISV